MVVPIHQQSLDFHGFESRVMSSAKREGRQGGGGAGGEGGG